MHQHERRQRRRILYCSVIHLEKLRYAGAGNWNHRIGFGCQLLDLLVADIGSGLAIR